MSAAEIISEASAPGDHDAFGALIREYVGWLRVRTAAHPWLVDMTFDHQSLDRELADLARTYAPPHARILLARRDGEVTGGVACKTLSPGLCEMKRLFVPDLFQGTGTGRRLCESLMAHAAADGFGRMRLDTGTLLHEAIGLYRALGFVECPPYIDYPERVRPFILFMERPL